MHRQLRDWDLPDWIVGQVSAASSVEKKNRTKSHSRARTLGPSGELPPPSNAAPLFRERLEALLESVALLEHMDEDLRGKYFVRTDVDTNHVYFSREDVPEETWETISEQYDLDPDETRFLVTDARNRMPGGVAKSPSEALAILIGVYALADGRMDLLVDELQRDPPPPESEVWDEIRLCVEGSKADNNKRDGLKVLAQHLATWVRGSEVRPGKPSGLSKAEHEFACTITQYRKEGLTDVEIARRESHRKKEDGTTYSVKDIAKLGDLGLSWS
jgi:hypothetical protein